MAVANSLGSNVFDILIGLALPWFFQTCILHPGSVVFTYTAFFHLVALNNKMKCYATEFHTRFIC